jgi:hypothetical protein
MSLQDEDLKPAQTNEAHTFNSPHTTKAELPSMNTDKNKTSYRSKLGLNILILFYRITESFVRPVDENARCR